MGTILTKPWRSASVTFVLLGMSRVKDTSLVKRLNSIDNAAHDLSQRIVYNGCVIYLSHSFTLKLFFAAIRRG